MKQYELTKRIKKKLAQLLNVDETDITVNDMDVGEFNNTVSVKYTYPSPMFELIDGKKIIDMSEL